MKTILSQYISNLREIKRIKEENEDLLKRLLHANLSNGKEISKEMLSIDNWATIREEIDNNMPDVHEIYMCAESHTHYIFRRLQFKLIEEDSTALMEYFRDDIIATPSSGHITDDRRMY